MDGITLSLGENITQVSGFQVNLDSETIAKCVELVDDTKSDDKAEVRIIVDDIEKKFTFVDFLGRLGF